MDQSLIGSISPAISFARLLCCWNFMIKWDDRALGFQVFRMNPFLFEARCTVGFWLMLLLSQARFVGEV
ncbi:TPA: hypothetical protein ACPJ2K_001554 [Vibrio alginolyticus]